MPASVNDLNYITVTGIYQSYTGTPLTGTVSFMPSTVLLDIAAGVIMMPVVFTATLDSNGAFSIDLPATDDPDITPSGWTYAVQENVPSGRRYSISIPYNSPGGIISLLSVVPEATTSAGFTNLVLLQDFQSLMIRVAALETQLAVDGGSPTSVYSGSATIDGGSL